MNIKQVALVLSLAICQISHLFPGNSVLFTLAPDANPSKPKLTLSQVERLIRIKAPDETIAGEIKERGISFTVTDNTVRSLVTLGAGPKTVKALLIYSTSKNQISSVESARPRCGNGIIEWPEQCDDGNNFDGDGCSKECRIESSPRARQNNKIDQGETHATSSTTVNKEGRVAFVGDVLFTDGAISKGCKIWDHNPGPIGSGWNEVDVGYCSTLDAAAIHNTNRSRKLQYAKIKRIDVLPLSAAERETIKGMYSYDRDKLIKCNVIFQDGSSMNAILLIPHYLEYECANETGKILRDTVKSLIFHNSKDGQ